MTNLSSDNAQQLRINLLMEQRTVQCDNNLAIELENVSEVVELNPGEKLISQGSYDDDLFFIIRGSTVIETNGHRHAFRNRGCHIGEIAILDAGSGRSASVFADKAGAVLLKVSSQDIRRIGNKYPTFWFGIARELSERLRDRDSLFIRPNEKPAIFIASSTKAAPDLKLVEETLRSDSRDVRPWTGEDIFMPSEYTLDSLLKQAHEVDFAIMIATPDDLVKKNAHSKKSTEEGMYARDNVFLEYGLFVGALERRRVFILQKAKVNLASDIQGLTCLRYETDEELKERVNSIAKHVDELGLMKRLVKRGDK